MKQRGRLQAAAFVFLAILISSTAFSQGSLGTQSGKAGQQAQRLSRNELKHLIATARTPEDHRILAAYYRAEGERLKAKQREHEEELAEYMRNPSSHPIPKWPTMGDHCRNLAFHYGEAAKSALALAELHEEIAKDAPKTPEQGSGRL